MRYIISRICDALFDKLFHAADRTTKARADMYLPNRLLAMAVLLFLVGVVCAVVCFFNFITGVAATAAICIVLGIFALLCWKNQKIHVISDYEFTYTTMFGNVRTYFFSEIKRLRKNADSYTLFVGEDKVHIEAMAVISSRLMYRIEKETRIHRKRE